MQVEGRVVDLYSRPETRDVVLRTGFRYALTIGGVDDRPFYLLRGSPEDISTHAGKMVTVLGVERPEYDLEEYAVLQAREIIRPPHR